MSQAEESRMSHPTKRQALIKAARQGRDFTRVEVPHATRPRCQREVYADEDGTPRGHLRDSRPGEAMYSEIVPTMTSCE
jgi:hypothetical protein